MKRKLFLSIIALSIAGFSHGQVMKKGDAAINVGIGLPSFTGLSIPTVTASFDMGITEKIGIGYISAGGQVAFSRMKISTAWLGLVSGFSTSTTNFIVGGRGAYHFDFATMSGNSTFDKLDIYAGIFMGLNFQTVKTEYEEETIGFKNNSKMTPHFWADGFAGIRYAISDNFKIYAELGGTIAYIQGGVSFTF